MNIVIIMAIGLVVFFVIGFATTRSKSSGNGFIHLKRKAHRRDWFRSCNVLPYGRYRSVPGESHDGFDGSGVWRDACSSCHPSDSNTLWSIARRHSESWAGDETINHRRPPKSY